MVHIENYPIIELYMHYENVKGFNMITNDYYNEKEDNEYSLHAAWTMVKLWSTLMIEHHSVGELKIL